MGSGGRAKLSPAQAKPPDAYEPAGRPPTLPPVTKRAVGSVAGARSMES